MRRRQLSVTSVATVNRGDIHRRVGLSRLSQQVCSRRKMSVESFGTTTAGATVTVTTPSVAKMFGVGHTVR